MFIFTCPHCQTKFQAENEWNGQSSSCPHCQQEIIITRKSLLDEKKKLILGIGIPVIILLLIMCCSGIFFVWEDHMTMESYARRFQASKYSSAVVDSPALYKLSISYISSFFVGGFRFFNYDYHGLKIENGELDRLQKKFYYLHSDSMQTFNPKDYFELLKMDEVLRRLEEERR